METANFPPPRTAAKDFVFDEEEEFLDVENNSTKDEHGILSNNGFADGFADFGEDELLEPNNFEGLKNFTQQQVFQLTDTLNQHKENENSILFDIDSSANDSTGNDSSINNNISRLFTSMQKSFIGVFDAIGMLATEIEAMNSRVTKVARSQKTLIQLQSKLIDQQTKTVKLVEAQPKTRQRQKKVVKKLEPNSWKLDDGYVTHLIWKNYVVTPDQVQKNEFQQLLLSRWIKAEKPFEKIIYEITDKSGKVTKKIDVSAAMREHLAGLILKLDEPLSVGATVGQFLYTLDQLAGVYMPTYESVKTLCRNPQEGKVTRVKIERKEAKIFYTIGLHLGAYWIPSGVNGMKGSPRYEWLEFYRTGFNNKARNLEKNVIRDRRCDLGRNFRPLFNFIIHPKKASIATNANENPIQPNESADGSVEQPNVSSNAGQGKKSKGTKRSSVHPGRKSLAKRSKKNGVESDADDPEYVVDDDELLNKDSSGEESSEPGAE